MATYVRSNDDSELLTIPHDSNTLKQIKANLPISDNILDQIIPLPFSKCAILEVIHVGRCRWLSEEAFRLVDFLDLFYLLHNYDIRCNSDLVTVKYYYSLNEIDKIEFLQNNIHNILGKLPCELTDKEVFKYKAVVRYMAKNNININHTYKAATAQTGMSKFLYLTYLIHFVARNGWMDIMQILLDNGADINKRDGMGSTPLYYACHGLYLDLDFIKYLVEHGSEINIEDSHKKRSLIDVVVCSQNTKIIKYFIDCEIDTGVRYKNILPMTVIAKNAPNFETIEYFMRRMKHDQQTFDTIVSRQSTS
jgi:hypothetical protein